MLTRSLDLNPSLVTVQKIQKDATNGEKRTGHRERERTKWEDAGKIS